VELPSTLLQRRPDIASAERAVFAANAEIGVAKAAFFPTISLGAAGGWEASAGSVLQAANLFWSLGPSISLPLFQGGLLKAREKQAYAVFNENTDDYRTIVLNAFREVEDARAQLSWLGKEQQDTGQAVKSAQTTLDVALTLYRDGATDYLNVVTAQTALLQSQQSDLQLRTRRLVADVSLIRALGGGWTVSDAPLPDWTAAAAANSPAGTASPAAHASLQNAKEPQ
jgi:NodT family efflux transporter outer membrane factor (OMF) lipoprotein